VGNNSSEFTIIIFYRYRLGKEGDFYIKKISEINYIMGIYKNKAIYSGVKKNTQHNKIFIY
jgi:hypothetical protein